ncbi:MAG: nuclear transport factor 2 family protein [Pseudomonadota bacterium]|nr:nuclear transport factor 2 family protein [Pseudomonadota bacterium]
MSLKEQIQHAQYALAEAFCAGDAELAAAHYTDDACLMPDGLPSLHGRAAIANFFAGAIAHGIVSARFTTEQVDGDATQALETGRCELFAALPNGERQCVDDGRYFVAWRSVDGEWRIFRDMFNRYKPAAP